MLTFTAPNGSEVEIDPRSVIRIRKTLYGEHEDANCRIDWERMNLVRETVDEVVGLVQPALPTLVKLTGGSNTAYWVNAKAVKGPFEPQREMVKFGYRSSITIMGYRQHLIETQDEVRSIFRSVLGES